MIGDDWIAVVRVKLRNMIEHDRPDGEQVVRELIDSEGLYGIADFPEDFEILSVTPADQPGVSQP